MKDTYLYRPATYYALTLLLIAEVVGMCVLQSGWMMLFITLPLFYLAHNTYQVQRRHLQRVDKLHLRTIEALAVAIDAKDNATHRHLRRVVVYAEAIAREMGLPDSELKALHAAALLHDIGKLAVPEYIISKPGRLTEEEFERMKIHTLVGAEILERVQFPYPVAPIVRSHHERWNGAGYPDGLKGEEIPIGARILSVVDSFDALASDRQYRLAVPMAKAMAMIRHEAGTSYDPSVVSALERIFPKVEAQLPAHPPGEARWSANMKVDRGGAPKAGLSIEKASDTSAALYPIVEARLELQVLYELTQALGSSLSVDVTLELLSRQLQRLIPFAAIVVYLIEDGMLLPRFVEGINTSLLCRLQIRMGERLSGWVAANGKYSLNGNAEVDLGYSPDPAQPGQLRSALSVPLDSSQGIIGALTLYGMEPNTFTIDHLRVLKAVGLKAGSTIHNAMIYEAMGKSAETDELTGLPNARALRLRLEEETARAFRQDTPFLVFVADLNGLKQINDNHGHLMGNRVIRAVGQAMRGCLREYDFVARTGGDEFLLLLPGMTAPDEAKKRIELVLAVEALRADFPKLNISISLGGASFPEDGQDIQKLIAAADRRMYWHKRDHRSLRGDAASAIADTLALA